MVYSLQWRAEWDFVRKGVGVGHIHLDCLLHTTLQMKHHHQVTHMIDILLNQFQNIRLIFFTVQRNDHLCSMAQGVVTLNVRAVIV